MSVNKNDKKKKDHIYESNKEMEDHVYEFNENDKTCVYSMEDMAKYSYHMQNFAKEEENLTGTNPLIFRNSGYMFKNSLNSEKEMIYQDPDTGITYKIVESEEICNIDEMPYTLKSLPFLPLVNMGASQGDVENGLIGTAGEILGKREKKSD